MLNKLKYYFAKPNESKNVSLRIVYLLWVVRIFSILFGFYQIFFGESIIGLAILACCIFIITPSFITFDIFRSIPIEIELILFVMVILQYIIGESQDFYTEVPYYDKFVHIMLPLFTGFMGFLVVYTLHFSGRLKVSAKTMVIFVIIATMGIGAIWEVIEYTNDLFIYPNFPNWHKFQGNIKEDPYTDTNNDLVANLVGGILGSLLALKYTYKKDKKNKRLKVILEEISAQLFKKRTPKNA